MADKPLLTPVALWEYRTQTFDVAGLLASGTVDPRLLHESLNWHGSMGWELTGTFSTTASHGGTMAVVLIFKRRA